MKKEYGKGVPEGYWNRRRLTEHEEPRMNADAPGQSELLDKMLPWIIGAVALIMIAYHLIIVWYPIVGQLMNQNNHLGFCMVLTFLIWAKNTRTTWKKIIFLLFIPVSLALVAYMAVNYKRLDMFAGWPEPMDVVIGVTMITLVIWQTWKNFGAIFPVLVLIAIAYALWGHLIPGVLSHPPFEFGYVVSNLSVGFRGIYGMLLNTSVNMLFQLLIFGAIFEATGVTRFFLEFGKLISRHILGGAGHTATFSSSFVGMVNGAAAANVALTGAYTIPMMKNSGFKGETAAGIEAMASTGGQLTPPIMGIAVFIMASFLGVGYGDLMFKAAIPAFAYYVIAVVGVVLIAYREKIPKGKEIADKKILTAGAPVFIIPIAVLTTTLVLHYSAGYAAFWGILTLLIVSSLQKATRPGLKILIQNLISGASMAAAFGMAVACIGMLIKSMTFTGAATKLSLVIDIVSSGHLFPALVLTMLLSILLSSSTPTVIAYIVVAFVAAPILVDMGLSKLTAHFFVFYYAVLAAVTPPIAGAAIVGSQIANTKYMKTSWEAFKLVGPFFLVPYFVINNPIIFGDSQPFVPAIMAIMALVMALGGMICFCQKYCFTDNNFKEQLLFLSISLSATWYGYSRQTLFFIVPLLITPAVLAFQWRRKNSFDG